MFQLLLFNVCVALSARIVSGHSVQFKSQCGSLPGGVTRPDSGSDITSLGFVNPKLCYKVLPGSGHMLEVHGIPGGDSDGVKGDGTEQ